MARGVTHRQSMDLKSDLIKALLRQGDGADNNAGINDVYALESDHGLAASGRVVDMKAISSLSCSCDIGFVMFMEDTSVPNESWTLAQWIADKVITTFAPSPSNVVHCELLVPPVPDSSNSRVHFATYLGAEGANWQSCGSLRALGVDWYLIENGARWRALPVFGTNCANALREAAERNVHAPYSLCMYATSARPLRTLSWLWSEVAGHKGHCATVTTRVLKEAGVDAVLTHPSAWYAPSSLLTSLLNNMASIQSVDPDVHKSLATTDAVACEEAICALLHAPLSYDSVRQLGDNRCIDAIRELTRRVVVAAGAAGGCTNADTGGRAAQKDLGKALLRWVLLRKDPSCPD